MTQGQRGKQIAHTGEVPSFLNFVYITHRFPAISSQAHVEFQAECQQEWKRKGVKETQNAPRGLLLEAEEGGSMDGPQL